MIRKFFRRYQIRKLVATALDDKKKQLKRIEAIDRLKTIDDRRILDPLCFLLNDADPVIRVAAAEALGEIGLSGAAESLGFLLKDSEIPVRLAAARALGRLHDERGISLLGSYLLTNTPLEVRRATAQAMGWTRDRAAIPLLSDFIDEYLTKGYPFVKEKDVLLDVIEALGEIGAPEGVAPLSKAMTTSQYLEEIIAAFRRIGAPEAVEPLASLLENGNSRIRILAAETLAAIGGARAIDLLKDLLGDPEPAVRRMVLTLLQAISEEIDTVVFGFTVDSIENQQTTWHNPDLTIFKKPLPLLTSMVIDVERFSPEQVETFLDHAFNSLGPAHLRQRVTAYIHGNLALKHKHLLQKLENLCRETRIYHAPEHSLTGKR